MFYVHWFLLISGMMYDLFRGCASVDSSTSTVHFKQVKPGVLRFKSMTIQNTAFTS